MAALGRDLWRKRPQLPPVSGALLTLDGNTYAISPGAGGRLLVLQDDQVVLIKPDLRVRLVAMWPPVAGWAALWIDVRTGAIGESDGLRLLDLNTGRVIRRVQCLFRLCDWEITNSRTRVADAAGRLLCRLSSGLVRVDLNRVRSFTPLLCRLADIATAGTGPRREGDTWVVAPGRWSFRLRAYSAWSVDSGSLRCRLQRIGFDADWSAPLDRPEISFSALPPDRCWCLPAMGHCRTRTAPSCRPWPSASLHCARPTRPCRPCATRCSSGRRPSS